MRCFGPHVHHPRREPSGIVWYFFVTVVNCRGVAWFGMVWGGVSGVVCVCPLVLFVRVVVVLCTTRPLRPARYFDRRRTIKCRCRRQHEINERKWEADVHRRVRWR